MIAWWTAVPFVVMLASIAVLPLIGPTQLWWNRPLNQLLVSLILGIPVAVYMITSGNTSSVIHTLVEYAQFVTLLFGLFVVAGGIALTGDLAGTPKVNTAFLAAGGVLSSLIGTTGAAMLLIRPMLISNGHRRHRAHTVIFSIFIMANCGGLLTPLGDPPLFLGLLRGVPFTWTLGLWKEWLFVNGLLLVTYFCMDRALMADEDQSADVVEPLGVAGKLQIIWFAAIIAAVALVPSLDLGRHVWWGWVPWREVVILAAAMLSWVTSTSTARFGINRFTFGPIKEVAALFIGIFLTMVPALLLLDEHAHSLPVNAVTLYLMTGGLSSVLDNAPTYATFFEVARAGGDAGGVLVAGVPEIYLAAISTGAVFFGAMTYIGNGPNFMVRAVAVGQGVRMPSFVGYVAWSLRWLLPVLISSMLVFIAGSWWARATGILIAALILVQALVLIRKPSWLPGRGYLS